ncbi:uncharacterized protein LOC114181673 [Vigna unguiculata]|uniref:OVATE domain-containing protein n=1 Tax=Vigna unguiculata TaxID=3917 RepID=A0A4D6LUJ4_VIGUN|nr:uncharacterized protein LOC114181673 [Vigna unguiculata]QCD92103.1 hypothetical protein DEO72_LG5g162 [Vigna unguiculata]
MLLSSISSTKKFFQKTIKNFKSFFSPGYQRLPKTSPHGHFSYSVPASSAMDMTSNTSYQDTEKFYTDFSDKWESETDKTRRIKKKAVSALPSKQESEVYNGSYISLSNASHAQKKNKIEKKEESGGANINNRRRSLTHQKESSSLMSMCMKEHKYCMVEQKLRELEMLDTNNVEYVLDIEEVLHYYSRLTCPAYLEIVDKFFLEMYSELFGRASPSGVSRNKLRYQ